MLSYFGIKCALGPQVDTPGLGSALLFSDLELANTFLDVAAAHGLRDQIRIRNIAHAVKTWADVTRLCARASIGDSDRLQIEISLSALKARIDGMAP
jgi:hypothetical protein